MDNSYIYRKLTTRKQHQTEGVSDAVIRGRIARNELVRVARGSYADKQHWDQMFRSERAVLSAQAAAALLRSDGSMLSHHSAAVMHGIPVHIQPSPIYFTVPKNSSQRSTRQRIRVHADVPPDQIVQLGNVACTSYARTLLDLLFRGTLEDAVISLDAALARCFADDVATEPQWLRAQNYHSRSELSPSGERLLEWLRDQVAQRPGVRHVRQARFVLDFATHLAESPAESLSRVRLHQIGFPMPELQAVIQGPAGASFRTDFLWKELGLFGEMDGMSKYGDRPERVRNALLAEKHREDAIRAITGWRCIRWQYSDLATPETFAAHLRNLNIHPK